MYLRCILVLSIGDNSSEVPHCASKKGEPESFSFPIGTFWTSPNTLRGRCLQRLDPIPRPSTTRAPTMSKTRYGL